MRTIILITLLVCSSYSYAAPKKSAAEYINLLKIKIKKDHMPEFNKLREWSTQGHPSPAPAFSPNFLKIMRLSEKVYQRAADEASVAGNSDQSKKYAGSSRWFKKANDAIASPSPVSDDPIAETEVAEKPRRKPRPMARTEVHSEHYYLGLSYFSFTPKISLKGTSTTETVESAFTGYALGGGIRLLRGTWVYGVSGDYFIANGNVEATKTLYRQENAVVMGLMITPTAAYYITPSTLLGAGLPVGFQSMKASDSTTTKASLESSLLFGPEVFVSQKIFGGFSLEAHVGLWGGSPVIKAGVTYNL